MISFITNSTMHFITLFIKLTILCGLIKVINIYTYNQSANFIMKYTKKKGMKGKNPTYLILLP